MKEKGVLSDVWLKASILGANWAASEIILGSFLHNLNIPFKGNILTAIGLILMISVAYIWKDKGLFWRSGLICALMKTISPSAVIFGPMVAIFMEALLFDASVRLLGRNMAGFFLGSALAMSWILFQKIFNYILFYGFSIVDIYANLLRYAENQLNIEFHIFWLPVVVLLVVYILFGLIATLAGMKIARGLSGYQKIETQGNSHHAFDLKNNHEVKFPYSITWLVLCFAGLISALLLINKSPIYVWVTLSVALVTVWVLRYKRAMRQLSRPGFWIFFIVITILSAMLISSFDNGQKNWRDGLVIGLQMNFRAAVVIVGFSVLGTELYNPKIRNYLARSAFKQLPEALKLAFESLPFIIAHLPDAMTFLKKPLGVIILLIRHSEDRFSALKEQQQASVFIVTGQVSEGKTFIIAELCRNLQDKNIQIAGFYAPRVVHNSQTIGYDLVSVETGEKFPFLSSKKNGTPGGIGKFEINAETLKHGERILAPGNMKGKVVVIIDEIGRLELNGFGWNDSLGKLLALPALCIVLAVRKDFLSRVVQAYHLVNPAVFPVSAKSVDHVETAIIKKIRMHAGGM